MFRWKKEGQLFNPATFPRRPDWMFSFAQAPCTLLFVDFVRVYFSCRPKPDESGQYVSYSAYVDLDRSDLSRVVGMARQPILELGGLGTFDEFGTYPVSVIRAADAVWGYYAGWTRCESVPFNTAIGFAKSLDDGKTFKKMGEGPVLAYSYDEPFVISGPKIRKFTGVYYLFYIAGRKWISADGRPEPIYKIRMASSPDGLQWTPMHRDLIPSRICGDEAQASPDVFWSNGLYHMFFCYRQSTDFRVNRQRGYRIGYAFSRDLITWTRDDARAGIDVSDSGWDSEMVAYPHVFELDGATYLLYLGNQVGKEGFGIARLEGALA
jgi:hypothetical protein